MCAVLHNLYTKKSNAHAASNLNQI